MNWQTFFESPLAVWIPVIVLVAIIIFAFRKQIGGLIDRLTSGNVEAGAEGVKVKIEAPPAPAQPATPAPTPPTTAAPVQPATTPAVEPPHHYGAVITNAKSTAGGALAEDQTGKGALIDHVEVKDDLIASSAPPPTTDPKA